MTPSKIISTFRQYQPQSYSSAFEWFKSITEKLGYAKYGPCRYEDGAGALVAWKDRDSKPPVRSYANVTSVTFDVLYHHAMLAIPDDFESSGVKELIVLLHHIKNQPNAADIQLDVKKYLNMIFGQLNHGPIKYDSATQNDVTLLARAQLERVYSHPKSVYADTDTVIIQSDIQDVQEWMNHINACLFPYVLEEYDEFALTRIKTGIRLNGAGSSKRFGTFL